MSLLEFSFKFSRDNLTYFFFMSDLCNIILISMKGFKSDNFKYVKLISFSNKYLILQRHKYPKTKEKIQCL